jgi:ribonuclease J
MKDSHKQPHRPPDDALWFLPLGGSGEIGMNLNLYGISGKWLIVDCGITFGDETTPGIDLITPDISFIAERKNDLVGIVLTHGHEDHIGALGYLWPQLRCPIFATKFTAGLIRNKLAYAEVGGAAKIIEIAPGGSFDVGPFGCEFIPVTHSIPESQMLALRTKAGTVLHTGDWKFDPDPILGKTSDTDRLKELGGEGLMALVCDSTNALVAGHSGAERAVQNAFDTLFPSIKKRIIVTCFASNIARLKSIAEAAKRSGRMMTLVGRSLWRNAETADECGFFPEFDDLLSENEAMLSPRDKIVIVATGCQGEKRAALSRIAIEDHPEVELDKGDTVIFSSRDIPGNEKDIARLQNNLIAKGVRIITPSEAPVHVSGHAAQEELMQLYKWTQPRLFLPVHGETRHQNENVRLAESCSVKHTLVPQNGQIIRLGPGVHEVVAEVTAGRWGLDGKVLRRLDTSVSKDRKKMGINGVAVVTLVMNSKGKVVSEPQVTLMGLTEGDKGSAMQDDLAALTQDTVEEMPKSTRIDDAAIRHAVALAVRRHIFESHGKKPVTDVHVVRV